MIRQHCYITVVSWTELYTSNPAAALYHLDVVHNVVRDDEH